MVLTKAVGYEWLQTSLGLRSYHLVLRQLASPALRLVADGRRLVGFGRRPSWAVCRPNLRGHSGTPTHQPCGQLAKIEREMTRAAALPLHRKSVLRSIGSRFLETIPRTRVLEYVHVYHGYIHIMLLASCIAIYHFGMYSSTNKWYTCTVRTYVRRRRWRCFEATAPLSPLR